MGNNKLDRIDHASGLANYITKNILPVKGNLEKYVFFFDFDRTLTNGLELSELEHKASIEKRIRGGKDTVDALYALKKRGAQMYIITARNPSVQVVEQLTTSLTKAQEELGGLFDIVTKADVMNVHEQAIATNGCLFSTGYNKELAIAYVLLQLRQPDLKVFLFDDVLVNCYSVHTAWKDLVMKDLKTDSKWVDSLMVVTVWWDPFFEETEAELETAIMNPIHSESSDFNFHLFNENQAAAFGITKDELKKRRDVYLSEEKKYNRKAPSTLQEKPPPAKKLKNIDNKFGGIAALMAKKAP